MLQCCVRRRLSSSVTLCIVAKRCVLEQKLLLRAYSLIAMDLFWLCIGAVTFRQFVANLLYNLQRMPSLSSLYRELSDVVIRYDDCVLTCSIPFTRRRRTLSAAERWPTSTTDVDAAVDRRSGMDVDVGLFEALAATLFGSKLRCHRHKHRHVWHS